MEVQRLRVKVGDHEFEAEGAADVVQAQFEAFRDLVVNAPSAKSAKPPPDVGSTGGSTDGDSDALKLDSITNVNDRVVSLTARGDTLEEEIMLLLLGQKMLRSNDSVSGAEIIDGLRQTGRTVKRVDYQLDKMKVTGDAITTGRGRARRYRLTNQGRSKAIEIARALIAKVA